MFSDKCKLVAVFLLYYIGIDAQLTEKSIQEFTPLGPYSCSMLALNLLINESHWHISTFHSAPVSRYLNISTPRIELYGICGESSIGVNHGGVAILLPSNSTVTLLPPFAYDINHRTESQSRFLQCFFTTSHGKFSDVAVSIIMLCTLLSLTLV